MKLPRVSRGVYPLFDLIRPAGSAPLPLDFEAAEALDAVARAAYGAGDYQAAVSTFRELASLLETDADAPHATILATNRDHAQRNAAAAAAMVDQESTTVP